ncbi:hypothetical protein [Kaistia sp. MMO-174]|uniref:hypothetical protein n=1 Tax=Kaistia sp. MMO-174 TaxID=3081256 RepID=UPI001ACA144D|nr:hypothetical protein [Hyphomicrobiales bacterium]
MTTKSYTGKTGKRAAFTLAALAVASLFIADIAPAVAQSRPSTHPSGGTTSSTVPGGPDRGGDGGMPSASCGEFGYANMPSGCMIQAVACICPNDSDPNYRAPSSCEGISRNARRAAERQCAKGAQVSRRLF